MTGQWSVVPVDGYNKPRCSPVYVRAKTVEGAETAGKELLRLLGIRRIRKVIARQYNPLLDYEWTDYIRPSA
ncbi:MAG: hypothetical protein DBP02_15275 [gamma proteobacterium symbiont of Ctena orbiculata]|nr:MAG: hypothetical protein DBP02_15275 [gamma proteobacterium symbiont of Ctena orbiculata]